MSDSDYTGEGRFNIYQQPWLAFSSAMNVLDPVFEEFIEQYGHEGWVFKKNVNRQPNRQVEKRGPSIYGRPWFCMGVDIPEHWYRIELTQDTLFEFLAVGTCYSQLEQQLTRWGKSRGPAPIHIIASQFKTLLADSKEQMDSWSLPFGVDYHVTNPVDHWEAGPYFPKSQKSLQ